MTDTSHSQGLRQQPEKPVALAEIAGRLIALEAAVKQILSVLPQSDIFVSCYPERLLDSLLPYASDCDLVTAAQDASVSILAVLPKD